MRRDTWGLIGRALAIAGAAALVLWLLHRWGVALPLALGLAAVVGTVAWCLPHLGVQWLDGAVLWVRGRIWAAQSGSFHSFAGVPLRVVDDGRQVWVDGAGIQRVLGSHDPEDVLAARHAGRWQRDVEGRLMLRVDAVLLHLSTQPARTDPRVQRLRRYLERDVVYPAQQRRKRG